MRRRRSALPALLYAGSLFVFCAPVYAGGTLPTGGEFAAGQGAIAGSGNNLTVNQSSSHGIIDWQSFSIGAPNSVQFNNGTGATLNRVTGGNLSRIDGSLSATGSVYLINPQGIVVGPGGKIVTNGSFVASTRDIPNGQFMAGGAMTASGTSNGDVVNAGTITSKTGDAILVGRSVVNSGTISAPEGKADLAAGNEIILQPVNGNSHIAVSGGKGDVTNTGTVKAAQAALDSAGGNVYALVQNNGGLVSATGTTTIDGHVWLTAGGSTTVSGMVSAKNADGSGGQVTVRSQEVSISGSVDASAMRAQKNGGDVSVIAKDQTVVTGAIKARGGAGGQGGAVETSGGSLDIGGAKIDAGEGGHWLLDPYDLTVDSAVATTISTSLDGGTDVTLQTTATGTSGPGNADASGSGDINIDSAIGWSSGAKLTLDAYHSIFVNAPITLTGDGGVVLKTNQGGSGGVYDFGLTDSGFTGNIDFGPSDLGGTLSINGTTYGLLYTMGDVAGINGGSGHYALATTIDASSAGTYSGAVAATLPGTLTGLGNSISNLTINDTSGNNNLGLIGDLSGTVRDLALTDAHVTSGDGAFAGVVAGTSTGTIKNVTASGDVSGGDASDSRFAIVGGLIGNVNGGSIADAITAVTVTQGDASSSKASYAGGIAGRLLAASITGSHASSDVIGGAGNDSQVSYSGGLVGQANGASTITDSYASGAISGGFHTYLGGLAGDDGGTITGSYATGAVTATASEQESRVLAGGLVGYAHGTISGSYATGNVTAPDTSRAGGLAGYSSGTISDSYASGAVSTGDAGMSGGLVGFASGGTITGSHASGTVETGDAIVTYGPTVVTNSYAGGFIGYVNTAATTITLSYATGATTGGATSYVGGFAGLNNGSITQSYATGSATTGDGPLTFLAIAGGFVGYNSSNGSIAEDFSIGAVSSTCVGNTACASVILEGLVGKNISTASAIKQSYFDSETSGQTTVGADFKLDNVVELTTAELQSGLPSGFNGGGNGRPTDSWAIVPGATFPYLAAQFSGTPQVISGTAYTDGGASVATSGTVSLLADGVDLGTASIGTNGYYYALEDQDTVQISTALLASTTDIAGSRLETGASALDSNGNVSGFDIWGGTLIAPTSETTYSAASATTLQIQDAALIATAVGGNTDPTTGLANYGYIASGDFTVDQSLTLSNGLYIKSLGDIAVPYALTLPTANGLTLDGAGTLSITAPITVSGAGAVSLAYDDSDPVNLSFGLTSQGFTGSIDFTGGSGSGASLAINDTAYTLLYSFSDLAGINTDSGLQGDYALAVSLDASSLSNWTSLGTDGASNRYNSNNGFSGSFTGLGHTISDLTVDAGSAAFVGLFGYSKGTLRDVGVVGGTATGDAYTGGLVGYSGGPVISTYATGAVNGSGYTGGLAGAAYGTVTNSYATGTVTATSEDTGGLIGFAIAAVSNSYATGAVNGEDFTGGLIGEVYAAVTNAYATGAVSGRDYVGGLIGDVYAAVTNAYATGVISARNHVGGLIGSRHATVTNGYWDTETSGLSTSAGGTGLTTAVFQAEPLTTLGFNSSVWSADDGLYPYLTWQYPNGARAVSGIAYSDAGVTPLASGAAGAVTVSALADGAALGSATTGANGYYYILVPDGTLSGSQQLLTYLDGASATANTYVADASGNASADLYGSWVRLSSDASSASAMLAGLSTALGSNSGSNFLYTSGSGFVSGASLGIVSGNTGGLVIDAALDVGAETISLDAAGPVTQSAPLTAGNLVLLGSGVDYTLTNGANAVDTLAADSGAINFASDTDLTIGTVLAKAGITSTGAVTLTANGDITIDTSIENSGGDDIVLTAGQNFINNAGSSALTTSGRWLVYSAAPGSDTFNGLDSGNTAIWNATYATLPPASVTQNGNRYLFATQPTLTVTTTDVSKTYGDDATSAVVAAYTISGYEVGLTGVYLGDSASSVYSGTPSVTSAGSATTADVPGSPYVITATAGSMDLLNGYALNFVDSGTLTVDPASLSITADNVGASSLTNVQLTSSYSGFVNDETSAVVSGLQYGLFPVVGNSLQYDIVPFGASAANYTISYYEGLLTIAQPSAPIINNQGNGSTNIGTQSSSDFTLSGNFDVFSFNNVTTASIGGSDSVALLFQVGLPGTVSPFDAIALNNYSNATDSDDRLLCPSGRVSGNNTSCVGAGGP